MDKNKKRKIFEIISDIKNKSFEGQIDDVKRATRIRSDKIKLDVQRKKDLKGYHEIEERFQSGQISKDDAYIEEVHHGMKTFVYTPSGVIIKTKYDTVDVEEYSKLPLLERRKLHRPISITTFEGMTKEDYEAPQYTKITRTEYLEQDIKVPTKSQFGYVVFEGYRQREDGGFSYIHGQYPVGGGMDEFYSLLKDEFDKRMEEIAHLTERELSIKCNQVG